MGWLKDLYHRYLHARHLPRHWQMRPRTLDGRIVRRVVIDNEYRLPQRFADDDVIVDVGAHVGSFALAALKRGAGHVHCFEPDEQNFKLLQHNLSPFLDRVTLHQVATWRSDAPVERLSLHNPLAERNTGAHQVSTLETESSPRGGEGTERPLTRTRGDEGTERPLSRTRGGEGTERPLFSVEAIAFDALVDRLAGARRLRLVKLDCEGAEWPILLTSQRLDRIDALCGEYHLGPLSPAFQVGTQRFSTKLLQQLLSDHGFDVVIEPLPPVPYPCGLFFAQRES